MTLVIPTGFAQAAIEMRHQNDPDPWYVTFGVDLSDIGGDYEAAMTNIYTAWMATFGQELSSQVTNSAVTLAVGQDGPDRLIFRKNGSQPGESDQQKLPQNCAILMTKNTGLGGRKQRGRFYIPALVSEANVDGAGILANGYPATYTSIGAQFLTELSAAQEPGGSPPTPMVLLHNSYVDTPAPTPVISLTCSDRIATQRRRLR